MGGILYAEHLVGDDICYPTYALIGCEERGGQDGSEHFSRSCDLSSQCHELEKSLDLCRWRCRVGSNEHSVYAFDQTYFSSEEHI
jgi:hypothetical protein